jgi:cytochrome P450
LTFTGTDTAAAALSNLTFHLLNNPETMRRLTEEVRTSFTDISEIRMGTALNGCEYLAACIDESLRLTPVLAGCQLREVLSGGLNIDGDHIPQGVDVGVPHHVIMRSSKYYDFPLEYRPQRWMTSETPEDHIRSARAAFCPFGIGNTSCVGRKWALIEMQLTIARLLFRFDINMVMAETEKGLSAVGKLKSRQSRDLDCFVLKTKGPMLEFQLAKTSRGS